MSALRKLLAAGAFRIRHLAPGLLAGLAAAAVYTAAQTSIPLVTGSIVDQALLAHDAHALRVRVFCLVGVAAVSITARGVHQTVFTWLGERSRAELQSRLLAGLYDLPLAFFDRERSGRLLSLLNEDASTVARVSFQMLSEATLGVLQLALILGVVAARYGQAVLAALLLIPLYTVFPLVFARRMRGASRDALAATAEVTTVLQEGIQAVREVKVFGREAWAVGRLRRRLAADIARQVRLAFLRSASAFDYALYFLVAAAVYWIGGRQVLAGQLTVGKLVALVALLAYLDGPVGRLARLGADAQRVIAGAERLGRIAPAESAAAAAGGQPLLPGGHRVAFEGVTFRYEESGEPALRDVSFTIEPGQRVAIVGPSGAGKSTLVGLLARLYEPGAGRILLDGRDLRSYDAAAVRREIGFVLQETLLFAGTVEENIRFGRLDATDAEIEECAEIANAHEFIRRLPQGYASEIGERGVQLSGGQRQRIGIARILLRKPGLLVLDEAMSALDTGAERLVREALERLMEGRTTFIIAHRPSAFAGADRIFVLDRGSIAAAGRHEELLAASPVYRRLAGEEEAAERQTGERP